MAKAAVIKQLQFYFMLSGGVLMYKACVLQNSC